MPRMELSGSNLFYNNHGRDVSIHKDGDGFSLTKVGPANPNPNSWEEKDSWRVSISVGGTPGSDESSR